MTIPNVRSQVVDWVNEHGTARRDGVERLLPIASMGDASARWARVGSVVNDIVTHAFATGEPLRVDGSRWSLSRIGMPTKLAMSLAAHDVLEIVPDTWLTTTYTTSLDQVARTPMFVSGSMRIRRLNEQLALRDLAPITSGASDGQTIAGATATGTHGAAISFGALHDSIRAMHFVVGPNESLLIQSSSAPLTSASAQTLQSWTGIPTRLVSDDQLFHASLVHLGSLGILLNVVLEVEPLYFLESVTTAHDDDTWRQVLASPRAFKLAEHGTDPWHVQVVLNPYAPLPSNGMRAWVTTMKKERFTGQSGVEVRPDFPTHPNPDLVGFLSRLATIADFGLTNSVFRKRITRELTNRYGSGVRRRMALPGVLFGPSSIAQAQGHSVEFVVDAKDAVRSVDAVLLTLNEQLQGGRQFLGGVGVRFVGKSPATLAPNAMSPSCFIELPTIRSPETEAIYEACARAIRDQGIAIGLHWGQYLADAPRALSTYWSSAAAADWNAARDRILSTHVARTVFASPILEEAKLGS